ncbi:MULTISPECIES: DoxX family protein [Streptomyces]|uniref:DoxX family protein n=2 Tax=Streptomyces TaxID=1883 RepID=A0A0W7XBW5_9ACTN|nr:DoxX family protein [Streptomyces silvensis]MVO88609.1 DoxX family membrane protein [Streptomyces typhae]
MPILRKFARPMLASVFVTSGVNHLRAPEHVAPVAESVAVPLAKRVPGLPEDPAELVRINAVVQVGAGLLLSIGRFPRLSALALAGSLVPTTLAGHAWWQEKDEEKRAAQRIHFMKNLSLFGGLLIAAADTHGKPSLAYRTRHAARDASRATRHRAHESATAVRTTAASVRDHLPTA